MDRRRKVLLVVVALLTVAALTPVGLKVKKAAAQDPTFCTNCHLMDGPWEQWSESAHGDITCVKCHPGDLMTDLRHGWLALTGATAVRGHVGVDEAACLGCHMEGKDPKWPRIAATIGHQIHAGEQGLSCVGCHGSSEHVSRPASEVCLRCHEQPVSIPKMTGVHCLECHNFLSTGSDLVATADTCRGCHQEGGKAPPVAAHGTQDCLACHQPHGAPDARPQACEACHDQDPAHHAESEATCDGCHAPHQPGAEAAMACASCHEGRPHGGHATCGSCHDGHGGDGEPEPCASCHADLPGLHTERTHRDCADCHDAHALGEVAPKQCLACHGKLAADHATVGCSGCHTFHR